jgi:hypothetical protein
MWLIAALLLISFGLLVFARIAEKRRMRSVLLFWATAAWGVAGLLSGQQGWHDAFWVMLGFLFVFLLLSTLIARPVIRRRVQLPCVRVREPTPARFFDIIAPFVPIAFAVFMIVAGDSRSFGRILFWGGLMCNELISLLDSLLGRIEICRNGLWQNGMLRPWEECQSFSWNWKARHSIELTLVTKSEWLGTRWSTRLVVRPEDWEAVRRLLEPHVPDLTAQKNESMNVRTCS